MEAIPTTLAAERDLIRGVFYAFIADPSLANLNTLEEAMKRYYEHMAERSSERRRVAQEKRLGK